MVRLTPVKNSGKVPVGKRLWKRVKKDSYLVVSAIMVISGIIGLNTYYPQYVDHNLYNSQNAVAYPVNYSYLYFNRFLFHQANFTFQMPSGESVHYHLWLVSQYRPVGGSTTQLYYEAIAEGNASNNTKLVGWESTYSYEFYQVNFYSDSAKYFNVTVTQEFTYFTVQSQPEWLTVLSFSSVLTGVMTSAIFITVRSKNEDLGKPATK